MTQKELSYVEDAIGHEKNIISICDETINMLEDEELISFFEKEIKYHEKLKNELMDLLEEKSNE
ncbi:MAG: hypothetical protein IJK67_00760 [Bacilli bacterium]|nr:hypothetical protein [Bacilli bacterium]